ncbi:hypothetical protein ETAA1_01310 [Urbifossiella limnaea]|uniref:Uncharacterized protein n=1 Tax=Urbifossiella limnaea TaxID=2528023 RepID=A0A517XL60_9BACT|nr:hypothetical protein ETAA1_01310 [Urbifossiella limnaea]
MFGDMPWHMALDGLVLLVVSLMSMPVELVKLIRKRF